MDSVYRKHISLLSIVVALVIMLLAAPPLLNHQNNPVDSVRTLALTPHAPIVINNDVGFASMAIVEGWPGDGSQADPYVIDSLDIDATGNFYAISISTTNVHFRIANCSLRGAIGTGVYLQVVSNFTLYNVSCYSSPIGFELYESRLGDIVNCDVALSEIGAYVYLCMNLSFSGNVFAGCGLAVFGSSLPYWSTHSIDSTNIANGKPVFYCKDSIGGSVPAWAGEIFLINCRDMVVSGRDINGTSVGITLAHSSGISVRQNHLTMQYTGIFLAYPANCNVSDNLFESSEYGIGVQGSTGNNMVYNNTCIGMGYAGIQAETAPGDSITRNRCTNCYRGIEVMSGDSFIGNNSCNASINAGIRMYNCWRIDVVDNNCSSSTSGDGLSVEQCDSVRFFRNVARDNSGEGIFMINSNDCAIRFNNLSQNWYGTSIWTSHGIVVEHNAISDNSNTGVNVFMCTGLVIFHNSFMGNVKQGLDDTANANDWDGGYPSGGNYWSDYAGADAFSGPGQNVPGADGIGDSPYVVDANTYDDYPLMDKYNAEPVASFAVSPQSGNPDTQFQLDAAGSYDEEDGAALEFRWDWESDGIWDTEWSTGNITVIHNYPSVGTYSVGLEVRDSTNKTNLTKRTISVVDLAPITIIAFNGTAGENGWYISFVNFNLSATDDWPGVATMRFRINGGSWRTYSSEAVVNAEGNNTIEYYSEDVSGNQEIVKSVAVKIDMSSPTTSITVSGASFGLSATDSISGVDRIFYRIDGGDWLEYGGNCTLTIAGVHTIEYYSFDVAGNAEAAKSRDVEVLEGGGGGIDPIGWALIIALIGILASITIPAIFGMRRKAKESDAKAQTKDIATAIVQFADDKKPDASKEKTDEPPKAQEK